MNLELRNTKEHENVKPSNLINVMTMCKEFSKSNFHLQNINSKVKL